MQGADKEARPLGNDAEKNLKLNMNKRETIETIETIGFKFNRKQWNRQSL